MLLVRVALLLRALVPFSLAPTRLLAMLVLLVTNMNTITILTRLLLA
jgi:hypothetical protein